MKPHILLCEPDALVALALQGILEGEGYRVTPVWTGQAALRAFDADPADVLVTEAVTKDTPSLHLVGLLRAKYPGLPVMILTAHEVSLEEMESTGSAPIKLMSKPMNVEKFTMNVRELACSLAPLGLGQIAMDMQAVLT